MCSGFSAIFCSPGHKLTKSQQSFQFADKLKPQPQHLSTLADGVGAKRGQGTGGPASRTCLSPGERAADTKNQLQ